MKGAAPAGVGGLLERAESMSALNELLAGVRSTSEGNLVAIGGEAGVGKTSLLRCFCAGQGERVRVLWGACEPLFAPRPLAPLLDVARVTGGELENLVTGAARPHEVVAALLENLGSRGPTVLVLEDVHWADEATLDVLRLLGTRLGSVAALVLASYRDDELGRAQQLRVVLGELVSWAKRLKVEPLSRSAVLELAGPGEVDAEELYRRTGGNPFYVTEVLATRGDQIPETVLDAVLARAASCSAPARALLDAVAVVPGEVDLWLLEALAGGLDDRLDECLASGMLISGRTSVAFRHELARLAIEEAMTPNRRVGLHRKALAALAAHGEREPDFARLAHHAEAAGDGQGVLRWAPLAGAAAAGTGAHREAAAQYARALRFADGMSSAKRAELLQHRADECYITDQFDEAIDAQQQALDCQRRLGDQLGEGDSLRSLSRLLFFVGRTDEAEPIALEAVELLERLPAGHELAMAYGNVSQRRMVVDDAEAAVAWGNRALELARRLDDAEVLVYALTNIGAAEFPADPLQGRLKLERALDLAQRHGLEEYAGRALLQLVFCASRQQMFEPAASDLAAGLEYCSERGLDTWRLYLLGCRTRLELDLGRWDQAAESASVVTRDPRSAPFPRSLALVTLGLLRARRGDPNASTPLAEAHALVHVTGEINRIGPVAAARAEAAWLTGTTATVRQLTDAALELALHRKSPLLVGELAYWRWKAGLRDPLPRGAAAQPYSLSIDGDWARASESWRQIGRPYEAALALADGDDPHALRLAMEELHALGASPAAAMVARRLRQRGVRGLPRGPRPRTRENPAGLTARELEVLVLLAEGLRNAQIAQRLVVSEKTVDHHVSAVLRKLEVRTRGQAGAEALRLGLIAQPE